MTSPVKLLPGGHVAPPAAVQARAEKFVAEEIVVGLEVQLWLNPTLDKTINRNNVAVLNKIVFI
jgi:hypothetical protein